MKKKILFFFLFFMFILSGTIFADIIYLKNGSKFTGRTLRQDAEKVVFRIGSDQDGMDITFFSEQVLRIDKAQVSSFITLPFGQGKQIEIPRPTFSKEPLLTEQASSQKRQKAEESRQAEVRSREGFETNTTPEEVKQPGGLPKITEGDLFLKQKKITEELAPLLDKEENDYFSKINSMIKGPADSAMFLLSNPNVLTQDSDKLQKLIKEMPSQMEIVIKQLNDLKPPVLFVNFHKKYSDNLGLIKEAFLDMSKGDIINSQTKVAKLGDMNNQLQGELGKILSEKKDKK